MNLSRAFSLLFALVLASAPVSAQRYVLKTAAAGLSESQHSNGVAVADYDLDGDLDVYIVASDQYDPQRPQSWNRFYRNNGNHTFTDVTVIAGVNSTIVSPAKGSMGNQFGAFWGDFDNDGYPDLFLTNYGWNELYRNLGNGTFEDITDSAGVRGRQDDHNSSAMWWDYDLDGDLDLYVCAWVGDNILYQNTRNGQFEDVSAISGLGDSSYTWTAIPIDANNDHLPDVYLANDYGPNTFYVNLGDGTFQEATAQFGLQDRGHGMGVDIGDFNNDGFFDIYLTNISSVYPCPLFENTGHGRFEEKARIAGVHDAGWGWGTEFFDSDHDGDLDLYVVNGFETQPARNFFFENLLISDFLDFERAVFANESEVSGCDGRDEARGLVVFDYDDDGDLDMLVGNWWAQPSLYERQAETQHWLKVDLEGTISNRDGFGAKVSLRVNEKLWHRLNDGIDFLGQSVMPLHFGLGEAERIDEILVTWPNGKQDRMSDIVVNQQIRITEGQNPVTGIAEDRVALTDEPKSFRLLGNYPNPFNGATTISVSLPANADLTLRIFDLKGRLVYSEFKSLKSGSHHLSWTGVNNNRLPVASGFYLYKLTFADQVIDGKLLLLK